MSEEKLSTRGRKRTLTDSDIKRNRSEVSSKWNKCRIYVGDQLERCRWMERTQGSAWLLLIGKPQGLVTIQVNILSMYKHIQGRTSSFTPARFKSCLFFKFLLIYSKPCLVQLPRPYSFQKISWPPLDYLLWRRSGRFCQEFARVENNMDPKWK